MASLRTPNSFLVFLASLVALVLFAIIFVVSIVSGPKPGDVDQRRADSRLAVRLKLEDEARTLVATEGFVDKAKGIVHVPVASVFLTAASELRAKKPAPSQIKVEPPLPMPVSDPKSTEPPPPALPSAPQGADTIRFLTPDAPESPSLLPKPAAAIVVPGLPFASLAPARPPLINWTETK